MTPTENHIHPAKEIEMTDFKPVVQSSFYPKLQAKALLKCNIDDWFLFANQLAKSPTTLISIYCTVSRISPPSTVVGRGSMVFFPLDASTGLPWECLSSLLTVGGVVEPTASVVGFIEFYHKGPIWMGFQGNNDISIDPKDQSCIGNVVTGKGSDNSIYTIEFGVIATPPLPWGR